MAGSRQVAGLREWSDSRGRVAVARRLCEGADGGVLAALAAAGEDGASSLEARESAAALLSRLTEALGLSPIARRGELLALAAEELGEFDVRGLAGSLPRGRRLYCVVRSGWWLASMVVERPLIEPVDLCWQGTA